MADTDFRVKNGLVTGTNNVTIGTTFYSVANGNVGVGTAVPGFKLAITGTLNATGAITQGGNQVLHAANFNTYTPTLTGTGASGTWGINVTGTANSVVGNIRGTINGDIAWTSGANITIAGESSFDLSGSGAFSVFESGTASNWISCTHGGNLNLVQNGKNAIVFGSRLFNDSGQQAVFNNNGNWSINALNITSHPLNQSVTTTAAPTFAGTTLTGKNTVAFNIASPSNYFNALQVEVQATSGTAGISLHRSGFSHVGIYHDSTNQLKFNMTSGTVTMNHDVGTVIGSGNFNTWAVARTSTNRNGVFRLFRNDVDDAYNVQTTWSADRSGHWSLRGYLNDTYHAPCYVSYSGYSDNSGLVNGYNVNQNLRTSDSVTFGYAYSTGDIRANGALYSRGALVVGEGQTSSLIEMRDTDNGTRFVHCNSGWIGFLSNGGGWTFRVNDSGDILPGYQGDWLSERISSHRHLYRGNEGYYCFNASPHARIGNVWADYLESYGTTYTRYLYSEGNVVAYSDRRLKTNLQKITDWRSIMNGLNGYRFQWNEIGQKLGMPEDVDVGLITQEVEAVLPQGTAIQLGQYKDIPERVPKDDINFDPENPYKTVKPEKIIPVLVEAIKGLMSEIEELKKDRGL